MASNYTDSTDTDFKGITSGVTYNIESGKPLSAEGVRNALHTKEKVANKVTTLGSQATAEQYPSAKAVYDALSVVSNTASGKQDSLPIGTILMYDGAGWVDNVTLKGWYKCDGYNGTPNLQDKFIKGKGDETAAGANWRQLTEANLPSHAHNGSTSSNGSHKHDFRYLHVGGVSDRGRGDYLAGADSQGQYTGFGDGDSRVCYASSSVMTDNSGHNHLIKIESNGSSGTAFNNMPAYYSVIYIKKIV